MITYFIRFCIFLASVMLLAGNNVKAEGSIGSVSKPEKVMDSSSSWKSEAELGVVKTSGNTETSSVKARIDVTNDRLHWRHNIHLEGYRSESGQIVSAERYQFSEKSDYKFNDFDYLFIRSDYEDDKFSVFDYQSSFSFGYGHRFLKRTDMYLDLEIGPGVRYSKQRLMNTEKEGFVRLASKFVWEISKSSRFVQEITSDQGEDLDFSKSISTIQANVNSKLAIKITHTIRHQSYVPVGSSSVDRETATTLVYLF